MSPDLVVESIARAHISLSGAPRGAAAAVQPDGTILATWGLDATPFTVFRIASMTKSFTAATVLSLRDDRLVSLDVPIADYAPELASVVGPGTDPAPITLRHLLTMSSGLATDDPWADRHLDATDDELDAWITDGLRFAHPTGTAFEYSNLGFALVGRVVLRATGATLQSHARSRILGPLGLAHTGWTVSELPSDADVTQGMHSTDAGLIATPPLSDGVVAPMGGLWSTTRDLCRWMAFLSSAFTDEPLAGPLAASSRRELQQVQRATLPRPVNAPDGSTRIAEGGYAIGLTSYVHERFGWIVTHSGGLPGYGSNMRWVPGGVGAVALANVTYAPMWHAGAALVDGLAHHGIGRPLVQPADAGVIEAANGLARLLSAWTTDAAASVFADNVLLDEAAETRQRNDTERLGQNVDVVVAGVERAGGAAGIVTLLADGRVHRVRIELAPLTRPRIQRYDWQ